jgi:hypothetical protein
MIRNRKHPELKTQRLSILPPCCKEIGRQCPQHLSQSTHGAYISSKAEQSVISELLDVWGHASIYTASGWNIGRLVASEESVDW